LRHDFPNTCFSNNVLEQRILFIADLFKFRGNLSNVSTSPNIVQRRAVMGASLSKIAYA